MQLHIIPWQQEKSSQLLNEYMKLPAPSTAKALEISPVLPPWSEPELPSSNVPNPNPNTKLFEDEHLKLTVNYTDKVLLVKAGVVPLLVEMLQSEDAETSTNAAAALSRIAKYPETWPVLLKAETIPALVKVLQKGVDNAKTNAAGVVIGLAASAENRGFLIKAEVVPWLIDLLTNGTPNGKANAASAIAHLVLDVEDVGDLAKKVIDLLASLLNSGHDLGEQNAAAAISNLALKCSSSGKADDKTLLVRKDLALSLIKQQQHCVSELEREYTAAAIISLARCNWRKMAPSLIELLKSEDVGEANLMARLIWIFAQNKDRTRDFLDAGIAPFLLKSLKEGSCSQKENAAFLIAPLAESDDGDTFLLPEIIPPLIELLRRSNGKFGKMVAPVAISSLAAKEFLLVSSGKLAQRILHFEDAVAPLVALLRSPEEDIDKVVAANAIMHLALHTEYRYSLVVAGAVLLLAELLKSGDAQEREAAAGALCLLAQEEICRVILSTMKTVVSLLMDLLKEETDEGEQNAAGAIAMFCATGDDLAKAVIADNDAIASLLQNISRRFCRLAINGLAGFPSGVEALKKTNAEEVVDRYWNSHKNDQISRDILTRLDGTKIASSSAVSLWSRDLAYILSPSFTESMDLALSQLGTSAYLKVAHRTVIVQCLQFLDDSKELSEADKVVITRLLPQLSFSSRSWITLDDRKLLAEFVRHCKDLSAKLSAGMEKYGSAESSSSDTSDDAFLQKVQDLNLDEIPPEVFSRDRLYAALRPLNGLHPDLVAAFVDCGAISWMYGETADFMLKITVEGLATPGVFKRDFFIKHPRLLLGNYLVTAPEVWSLVTYVQADRLEELIPEGLYAKHPGEKSRHRSEHNEARRSNVLGRQNLQPGRSGLYEQQRRALRDRSRS